MNYFIDTLADACLVFPVDVILPEIELVYEITLYRIDAEHTLRRAAKAIRDTGHALQQVGPNRFRTTRIIATNIKVHVSMVIETIFTVDNAFYADYACSPLEQAIPNDDYYAKVYNTS